MPLTLTKLPREKNLTEICEDIVGISGCRFRTEDIISLMREALEKSSVSMHLGLRVERFFDDQGEAVLLKEPGRRGLSLLVQRAEFWRVLEDGKKIPREIIRVFKFRWAEEEAKKVVAFRER